ncbi:methionyl-tRNA formyltransferase [Campylobacter geochelonis]|uniref:methionyl-tRNA formyltransferase n=1 Tax=Campylobacter geochelonis TaxID=1780362 RepID=UPI000770AEA2|nr:methionyl-tRNA formyltransferase [Campylobacter geochelonis]CZE46864.1 methionyl-tRNA formyltransferase [Campylobacter geochelonis]CZE50265.1 methionyl-tRNA formyltransferase [Campylobacter geochelonis]
MKIVFMGTPEYATVILKKLLEAGFDVVGVFTQPDKPVGRKQVLTPPDVKNFIIENNIKTQIFQPQTLKNSEIYKSIEALKPDFIVVAAYGQILPKEILQIAPCINLHASILPEFRGASPIQSAILAGDTLGGVSAMRMGEGLDDGEMLGFSFMGISSLNSQELFLKFATLGANLAIKVLNNFSQINPIAQIHALSSKCTKIKKEDGLIKFSDSVDEVMRKFRAFFPWPGVFLENGIKLLDIKIYSNLSSENLGKIINIDKNSFILQFQDGQIEVLKLQEVGKKAVLAKDFINGKRLGVDDRIC